MRESQSGMDIHTLKEKKLNNYMSRLKIYIDFTYRIYL